MRAYGRPVGPQAPSVPSVLPLQMTAHANMVHSRFQLVTLREVQLSLQCRHNCHIPGANNLNNHYNQPLQSASFLLTWDHILTYPDLIHTFTIHFNWYYYYLTELQMGFYQVAVVLQ
jgi:hypothetical protein